MRKEISQPVMFAAIGVVVVAIIVIGWFVVRPAPVERVPPRASNMTRTSLLQQRMGQAQQPGTSP